MDLTERVFGLLILLYAQPLPRIVRLTIDDITTSPDDSNDAGNKSDDVAGMFIRLGNPPAPVPAPFDQVIADYLSARPNLTTATNPAAAGCSRADARRTTPVSGSTTPPATTRALTSPREELKDQRPAAPIRGRWCEPAGQLWAGRLASTD